MHSNDPLYTAVNTQDPDFYLPFTTLDPLKARDFPPTAIFVCNPPRERLPAPTTEAWGLGIDSRLAIVRDDPDLDNLGFYSNHIPLSPPTTRAVPNIDQMPTRTRRISIQSILVPTFLQGSSSTPTSPDGTTSAFGSMRTRANSSAAVGGRWGILSSHQEQPAPSPLSSTSPPTSVTSPRDSPPPDFLLDDDPFANLSSGPSISRQSLQSPASPPSPPESVVLPPTPRSPLMPTVEEVPSKSLSRANSTGESENKKKIVPRAFTARAPVAAHQRPAFSARPSLPSLSTLAQMNVVLTKKVRKGRPGAGLPFEPWDNPDVDLPPRVLQDIHATSTQSLPIGTQPLLPSQIVGIATSASATAPVRNKVGMPSHTYAAPSPSGTSPSVSHHEVSLTHSASSQQLHFSSSDFEQPQWSTDSETRHVNQSQSESTFPSTSSSDSGHGDLLDGYYHRDSTDNHEEEENAALDDEALSMYQPYQQCTELTDFDTDTTTTASNSCDELSPPPSSRVSSLDLETPYTFSRSISSTSSRLSESSSARSSVGHDEETHLHVQSEIPSRSSAVIDLENQLRISFDSSVGTSTTRPPLEDNDSLRSPFHPEFDVLPQIVTSPESYLFPALPEVLPLTPGLTSSSSQSGPEHYRVSHSSSASSSALWTPASNSPLSYFPPFHGQGTRESSAKDLVARWRDRYARMDSFGTGSGNFLSDLELSDPLVLDSSSPTPQSQDWPNRGPLMEEQGLAPVGPSAAPTHISNPRTSGDLSQPTSSLWKTSASLHSEGLWPSSADTVRPFSRGPASADIEGKELHDGEHACDIIGQEHLGMYVDGNMVNSSVDGFDGVAIESCGAHVNVDQAAASVPCKPSAHSSTQDSAEDPFELQLQASLASSTSSCTSITSSVSASTSLSPSTSSSHSARSTSSYASTSTDSTSSSVYKDNFHHEDYLDMLQVHTPWDGHSWKGKSVPVGSTLGDEVVDGSGREDGGYRGRSQSHSASSQQEHGVGGSGWSGSLGGRYNAPSAWGRSGGGRGDDGDDEDHRRRRQLHRGPEPLAFSTSRRNAGSDSEDDHGVLPPTATGPANTSSSRSTHNHPSQYSSPRQSGLRSFPVSSTATSSDDDDVPLAQRIPTALTAQKSIRRQVREERHQKKLERAATTVSKASSGRELRDDRRGPDTAMAFSRDRHATLRPVGAVGSVVPPSMPPSSSQDAALAAGGVVSVAIPSSKPSSSQQPQGAAVERRTTRARAYTMQSRSSPAHNPFLPEDLAVRLQNVQMTVEQQHQGLASASATGPSIGMRGTGAASGGRTSFENPERSAGLARGRTLREQPKAATIGASPTSAKQGLRPMRSFHRENRAGPDEWGMAQAPALPSEAEQKLALQRQFSRSQSRATEESGATAMSSMSATQSPRKRSVSVSRAPPSQHAYGADDALAPPVPPLPSKMGMDESVQQHAPRKLWKAPGGGRQSIEADRAAAIAPGAQLPSGPVVQQRVFVGDMQRFNMVEFTSATTAGDVVEMIEAQGGLQGISGTGGWMVFEVAQDFGMERPIRSFELLSDVQASWNKDKMVNLFVLKLTPLSDPLSRNAIPSSSPLHSGYVEFEQKRGKWSKRFMQLREHSLWLSKREGKEPVLLCSLSNFDAYFVNRNHRTPKPFAFSVKSTDSLTFFENTADYVHNFSCNEKEGKVWMEKILLARSYVLHQERQILFNPKAAGGNASGAVLSRAGTLARKPTTRRPVEAPLVSVPPLVFSDQVQRSQPFEPGSLLSKQL